MISLFSVPQVLKSGHASSESQRRFIDGAPAQFLETEPFFPSEK